MCDLLRWRVEHVGLIIKVQTVTLKNIIDAQFTDVKTVY